MKEHKAHILSNKHLGGRYYQLDLKFEQAFDACQGGEFLMISTGYEQGHVLRRPMAIFDQQDLYHISVLYQVVGQGTAWLSLQNKGHELSLLGALGNQFMPAQKDEKIAIVAGGIGTAPFLLWLKRQQPEFLRNIKVYFGFRNHTEAKPVQTLFSRLGVEMVIWTDEKNEHYSQGLIVNAFFDDFKQGYAPKKIYTCGPNIMMKAIFDKVKDQGVEVYASAEAKMACGMGVCLSCVTETSALPIGDRKLICKDGPVLKLQA
ncbi:MAG TPA: hypothetical protein PKC21_03335 [Oligoflexia bacterium]|nr:hypothetical protein [Oligoflexia bacterium]HMR24368.1 hypothetical protein [Oligoflexia bacterium]